MKPFCRIKSAVLFFILSFILVGNAFAASLALTQIGSLSTEGKTYTEWWYSGVNPTLSGTAGENATVTIIIGENTDTVTADASGNWTYATTLSQSDPVITLTSGSESYSFTLHVGQVMDSTSETETTEETEESTASVPGTWFPQTAGFIFGSTLVLLGIHMHNKSKRAQKEAYVESVLNSLE